MSWLDIPGTRIQSKRDAINKYVQVTNKIYKESERWPPKYSPGKVPRMVDENLKDLAFMLGIKLEDDAIDPKGRTDRDPSVFD
jgi:hypothetical protein